MQKTIVTGILLALPVLLLATPILRAKQARTIEASEQWPEAAPSGGSVVDENGKPLVGVRYWVSGNEERTETGWQIVQFLGLAEMHFTGEDGAFEIAGRDGLRSDVDFDRSGFTPAFLQELEPGERVRVVMQRGFDVRGRVEQRSDADGHPVEGARVSIRRPNARGLWFETEVATDLTGGFSFPGFLQRSAAGEEHAAPDSGWQLVCAGAVYELPERSDGPIDGIRVEVVIRREER